MNVATKALDETIPLRLSGQSALLGNAPECGSHSDARWYCVEAERFRESEVSNRLDDQGFGSFLPLVIEMRPVRPGLMQAKAVPAFPGYLFARFDIKQDRWRSIVYTRGVKGLFCSAPDRPTPVPQKQIMKLIELGYDKPIAKDPRPELIEAGAKVRVTAGPFAGHDGICQWDDRKRIGLLMDILGGTRVVPVPREWAEKAS